MIHEATIRGARAAAARFGVREASLLQTLLGTIGAGVGGSMVRGALNAASPNALTHLENLGAAPVNMVRRALNPTAADVLAKHLTTTQPTLPPNRPRIV